MEDNSNKSSSSSTEEIELENPISSVKSPEYSLADLYQLIKDVTHCSTISSTIQKQITKFVIEQGMSFKEIARCIVWCDEVGMKNKTDKWNPIYGIGCIGNVREQANQYFAELAKREAERQRIAQEAKIIAQSNIIFNIKQTKKPRRSPKHFNIEEIEVSDLNKERNDEF